MIRRPSYASVTSTLALFIALGGTGYAAVGTSGGSTSGAAPRFAGAPPLLGYAHVVADSSTPALVTLDTGLSWNVTGVYAPGAVAPSGKQFVCVYGNFSPHAIAATAEINAGQKGAQLTQVDIADGWMIARCPQNQNGIPGRVIAAVTLPLDLSAAIHGTRQTGTSNPAGQPAHAKPACSTTINVNGTRQTGQSNPAGQPHTPPVSPDPHQCGVFLLFY